jgi:hypothetical protein
VVAEVEKQRFPLLQAVVFELQQETVGSVQWPPEGFTPVARAPVGRVVPHA